MIDGVSCLPCHHRCSNRSSSSSPCCVPSDPASTQDILWAATAERSALKINLETSRVFHREIWSCGRWHDPYTPRFHRFAKQAWLHQTPQMNGNAVLDIRSREGAGELRFGMLRTETRSLTGHPTVFRRAAYSLTPCDLHFEQGIILEFDTDDRLRTVELTPRSDATVRGVQLFGRDVEGVVSDLAEVGVVLREQREGWDSSKLGMSFVGPNAENEFQSVLVSSGEYFPINPEFFSGGPLDCRLSAGAQVKDRG